MVEKIESILTLLDMAKAPDVLNAPSFRLHQLKGELKVLERDRARKLEDHLPVS